MFYFLDIVEMLITYNECNPFDSLCTVFLTPNIEFIFQMDNIHLNFYVDGSQKFVESEQEGKIIKQFVSQWIKIDGAKRNRRKVNGIRIFDQAYAKDFLLGHLRTRE